MKFRESVTVSAACRRIVVLGALSACLVGTSIVAAEPAESDNNPYLAAPRLDREALVKFIQRMQTKPVSLRKLKPFQEAIVEAADRVLAANETDAPAGAALIAKLAALHRLADGGKAEADEQLTMLATAHRDDERAEVAAEARFYVLEREALDADGLEPEDLEPLLAALKTYCESHDLDSRHLRLASATVKVINRLPDDAKAAEAYRDFGQRFAKSEDPELARYGRKIQAGPKDKSKAATPQGAKKPLEKAD